MRELGGARGAMGSVAHGTARSGFGVVEGGRRNMAKRQEFVRVRVRRRGPGRACIRRSHAGATTVCQVIGSLIIISMLSV